MVTTTQLSGQVLEQYGWSVNSQAAPLDKSAKITLPGTLVPVERENARAAYEQQGKLVVTTFLVAPHVAPGLGIKAGRPFSYKPEWKDGIIAIQRSSDGDRLFGNKSIWEAPSIHLDEIFGPHYQVYYIEA